MESLADIPVAIAELVPDEDDETAWSDLAKCHHPDCEWIATRAHRRPDEGEA